MATIPDGAIDVAMVEQEIDAIQADVLALLMRGRTLIEDREAALTAAAREAGLLVCQYPYVQPEVNAAGAIVTPMQQGGLGPIGDERWAALNGRLDLVAKLATLLNTPLGNANKSFAQQIRSAGRRWRAQP